MRPCFEQKGAEQKTRLNWGRIVVVVFMFIVLIFFIIVGFKYIFPSKNMQKSENNRLNGETIHTITNDVPEGFRHMCNLLRKKGIRPFECYYFFTWAFGEDYKTISHDLIGLWNKLHGDIFILTGHEEIEESLLRMAQEYRKQNHYTTGEIIQVYSR